MPTCGSALASDASDARHCPMSSLAGRGGFQPTNRVYPYPQQRTQRLHSLKRPAPALCSARISPLIVQQPHQGEINSKFCDGECFGILTCLHAESAPPRILVCNAHACKSHTAPLRRQYKFSCYRAARLWRPGLSCGYSSLRLGTVPLRGMQRLYQLPCKEGSGSLPRLWD
jgi:hypothetical protein